MSTHNELAAQLRDIHLPPGPPWWPPQPGWWLLLALLALAVGWWWLRRLPLWKREALERLKAAEADYARHRDAARLLADVSVLLRACALKLKGRAEVAGLTGAAWLECLRELGRGACPVPGEVLLHGPYQRHIDLDAGAVARSVALWIRRSRQGSPPGV